MAESPESKTVGTISANEYARLRAAEAKIARVEALCAKVQRRNRPGERFVGTEDLRAALRGDDEDGS